MPIKSANYYQTLTVEDMDIEIQGNCKENKRENQFEKGFGPFNEEMIDDINGCLLPLVIQMSKPQYQTSICQRFYCMS